MTLNVRGSKLLLKRFLKESNYVGEEIKIHHGGVFIYYSYFARTHTGLFIYRINTIEVS